MTRELTRCPTCGAPVQLHQSLPPETLLGCPDHRDTTTTAPATTAAPRLLNASDPRDLADITLRS